MSAPTLTSKASAWDDAVASNARGYRRGVKAALDVIAELRRVYRPSAQGRQRFTIHDMERALKGGLDIAREDIEKLLTDTGTARGARPDRHEASDD